MTDTDNKMIDEFLTTINETLSLLNEEETKIHQIRDDLTEGKSLKEVVDELETILGKIDWDLLALKETCRKFRIDDSKMEYLWELSSKYPDHDFKFCPDIYEVMYKLTLIDSDSEWEYFDPLVNYYQGKEGYNEDDEAW